MRRFFGMMPSSEIEMERRYKDESGLSIKIQAGKHGWTIIYADGGTEYEDVDATAEENFDKAYNIAVTNLGELTPLELSNAKEIMFKK